MRRLIAIALLSLLLAAPALAGSSERFEPWSAERVAELRASGQPFLIDVFATWCGTCKRQGEIIEPILAEAAFADLPALRIDWDTARDQARQLGAPRQSTLILLRGDERIALSVADTDPTRLRDFLQQALN